MAQKLKGSVRVSPKGISYISIVVNKTRYSVVEFPRPGVYRIFYPIPAPKADQTITEARNSDALLQFFQDKGMVL